MARSRALTLSDGRTLSYHEFGAPDGVPCLYTGGWPSSGLIGGVYDEAARDAGIRWISIDKPGCGCSAPDPRPSLPRYAEDVRALADHLALSRFAVAGESGGGPHALAVAHAMPSRVTVALVLAGIAPAQDGPPLEGMNPTNRRLITMARRAPWLLRLGMAQMARSLRNPRSAQRFEQAMLAGMPEVDRAAWDGVDSSVLLAAAADALRDGGRSATREMVMVTRPWGFALSDVQAPVQVWHGTEDQNAPVAGARHIIAQLPRCTAHIVEGAGHCVGAAHRQDVMAAVLRAAEVRP